MKKLITWVLVGVMATGLIGCGGPSAEETVENYFTNIKKVEVDKDSMSTEEKATLEYLEENFAQEFKTLKKKAADIIKDVDVEILSTEEKDNTATVDVNIKAIDASEFFVKFISELFTQGFTEMLSSVMSGEEQMNDEKLYGLIFGILDSSLKDVKFKTVDRKYTIELKKVDNTWEIIDEEALSFEILNIDSKQYKQFESQLNKLQ